jgi:hypothetical protein
VKFTTKIVDSNEFLVEEILDLFGSFVTKFSREELLAFLLEQWTNVLENTYDVIIDVNGKLCEINWYINEVEMAQKKSSIKHIEHIMEEEKLPPQFIPTILKFGIAAINRLGEDLHKYSEQDLHLAQLVFHHELNKSENKEILEILTEEIEN